MGENALTKFPTDLLYFLKHQISLEGDLICLVQTLQSANVFVYH